MKLHEFQKESNRLCKEYRVIGCEKCPLHKCHCATYKGLTDFAYVYDAVSAWSDSHPIKTRQSEFLKMFPNAYLETITRLLPCSFAMRAAAMRLTRLVFSIQNSSICARVWHL